MFVVQIRPGISRHDIWKSSAKEIVNAQNLLVFDVRATISTCIAYTRFSCCLLHTMDLNIF